MGRKTTATATGQLAFLDLAEVAGDIAGGQGSFCNALGEDWFTAAPAADEADERSLVELLYGTAPVECEHAGCGVQIAPAATYPACTADRAICCSCCS